MSAVHDQPFPRLPLIAAFGLVGLCVLAVAGQRLAAADAPPARAAPQAAVVRSVDLTFFDRADGGVRVVATDGSERAIAPASGGFVRGVLRSLVRERRALGLGAEQPFRLTEWNDGAVTVEDLATGRTLNLNAFGPTNRADALALIRPAGDTA